MVNEQNTQYELTNGTATNWKRILRVETHMNIVIYIQNFNGVYRFETLSYTQAFVL